MDLDRLREIVASIPPGHWMSYGDLAAAAGGNDRHARTLNQRFIREEMEGAHRILKSDGTIGGTALGDPAEVRRRLEAEGLEFEGGRAHRSRRLRPPAAPPAEDTADGTPDAPDADDPGGPATPDAASPSDNVGDPPNPDAASPSDHPSTPDAASPSGDPPTPDAAGLPDRDAGPDPLADAISTPRAGAPAEPAAKVSKLAKLARRAKPGRAVVDGTEAAA